MLFLIVITTNSIIIFKPLTVAIIVISLFGMYGIGFIFGALSLIYKRIQDIIPILQYLLLAIISLPASSNIFANIIPIYSTSSLLKRLLDNNDILFSEYILFSFSSIFYLIIGVLLFNSCDKFVRKKGIVGRL
ncbi:hypothetical protein A21D_00720 [Virgibacillus dokdonensis]|uniref:Uncharacterized protein n=1 Tax=Virgibacillus dokdonensis TaxID=302167 RepID=A0A2K9IVQ2_9BACI|nr:hypothetical protein A21D_00720 [Virgibacillus dokdonensis]